MSKFTSYLGPHIFFLLQLKLFSIIMQFTEFYLLVKLFLMWVLKQLTEFSTIILMAFMVFLVGSQVYNLRQRNSLKYKIVQLYSENFTIHSIFRKKLTYCISLEKSHFLRYNFLQYSTLDCFNMGRIPPMQSIFDITLQLHHLQNFMHNY